MTDLNVGDVVVWVRLPDDQLMDGQKPVEHKFDPLRNFTVSDVAAYTGGRTGILLSDGPVPKFSRHFDARCFRRVYRPKADLISKLLEPVDLFSEARQ